jgi:tumor protein p53-inducible protein 3
MRAILAETPGGPEQLAFKEMPVPELQPHEILVKVKAAGVNHLDLLQREGKYPPPKGTTPVLGVDISGIVEKIGDKVSKYKRGDKVMNVLNGGGYAEYAAVHEEIAMSIPANLSFEEAAAVPEVFLTAYQALFFVADIQPGNWVLIHAGASGVGTAAIQLVKEMEAHCVITAGSQDKIEFCLNLGAHTGFNHREGPFAEKVFQATAGRGCNIIIDPIGAAYWTQNLQCLASEGILILLHTMSGRFVEKADLAEIIRKWAAIKGSTLRSRPQNYKIRLVKSFEAFCRPRFETGKLKPIIDTVFPWEKAADAHHYLQSRKAIGKLILTGM